MGCVLIKIPVQHRQASRLVDSWPLRSMSEKRAMKVPFPLQTKGLPPTHVAARPRLQPVTMDRNSSGSGGPSPFTAFAEKLSPLENMQNVAEGPTPTDGLSAESIAKYCAKPESSSVQPTSTTGATVPVPGSKVPISHTIDTATPLDDPLQRVTIKHQLRDKGLGQRQGRISPKARSGNVTPTDEREVLVPNTPARLRDMKTKLSRSAMKRQEDTQRSEVYTDAPNCAIEESPAKLMVLGEDEDGEQSINAAQRRDNKQKKLVMQDLRMAVQEDEEQGGLNDSLSTICSEDREDDERENSFMGTFEVEDNQPMYEAQHGQGICDRADSSGSGKENNDNNNKSSSAHSGKNRNRGKGLELLAGKGKTPPAAKTNPKSKKRKRCTCVKSQCLKLYCECFSMGVYCLDGQCKCTDCCNSEDNTADQAERREEAVLRLLKRRGNAAFRNSSIETKRQVAITEGCKCRKSRCIKKYCECYAAGLVCRDNCKCEDCANNGAAPPPPIKRKRKSRAKAAVAQRQLEAQLVALQAQNPDSEQARALEEELLKLGSGNTAVPGGRGKGLAILVMQANTTKQAERGHRQQKKARAR